MVKRNLSALQLGIIRLDKNAMQAKHGLWYLKRTLPTCPGREVGNKPNPIPFSKSILNG